MNMSFFKNIMTKPKKRRQFKLTVPNLDDFENPRTIINPSELKRWLNDLPLANQNVAIKDILTEIQLINRYPKKIAHRKKLIEKFDHSHKVLFLIARNLSKRTTTAILTNKEMDFLEDFYLLNQELAYGYKIIINEEYETLSLKKISPLPFLKTMWLLQIEMVFIYCGLKNTQSIVWKEVLQLYRASKVLKINQCYADDKHEETGSFTVNDFFKKMILFQLSDPYRMQASEMWDLLHYINTRVHLAKLIQTTDKELTPEQILVDMRGSVSILALARKSKDKHPPSDFCILDMTEVIKETYHLLNLIDNYQEDEIADDLRHIPTHRLSVLLKKMLVSWQLRPKRSSQRIEQYGKIEILSGLTAVHDGLSTSIDSTEENEEEDFVFNKVQNKQLISQQKKENGFNARQINISHNGMGGEVEITRAKANFHVGQLILFRDKAASDKTMLAVIQRLYPKSKGIIGFGVELLKGEFQAITYHLDGAPSESFVEKGVILKQDDTKEELIAPLKTYSHNQIISINSKNNNIKYKAVKLVTVNEYFQRIEITHT